LAPVVDSILSGLEIVRIGADVAASDSAFSSSSIGKGADIGLGVGLGILFLGSAIYGYRETSRCSEALDGESDESSAGRHDSTPAGPARPAVQPAGAIESGVDRPSAPNAFNLQSARIAIMMALSRAAQRCGAQNGMHGQGAVTLTYLPDGHVADVMIAPSFIDSAVQSCVANSLREASVSRYEGEPITVRKHFDFGADPKETGSSSPDGGVSADVAPTQSLKE
jgi:hypothetical protein